MMGTHERAAALGIPQPVPDPRALTALKQALVWAIAIEGQDTADRIYKSCLSLLGASDDEVRAFTDELWAQEQAVAAHADEEERRARGGRS